MGMFDEVAVPCPKCGTEFWAQSKSGDCNLGRFTLDNAPISVLVDINRHAPFECKSCGNSYWIAFGPAIPMDHSMIPEDHKAH